MEFDSEFWKILETTKVKQPFREWLKKEGVTTSLDYALLVSDEKEVQAKIIEASGVEFATLGERTAVAKTWWLCRSASDRQKGLRAGTVTKDKQDEPLDNDVIDDLHLKWNKRHRFRIPAARLLVDSLFARRYRQINAPAKKLTVIMPEQLRTLDCVERRSGLALICADGKQVQTEEVIADEVQGHHELYIRVRADFTTMALVSIQDPAWLDFETCEEFLEDILMFTNMRFGKARAPVQHFVKAYGATMQIFVDNIRKKGQTMKDCINNTAKWHHLWTVYSPAPVGPIRAAGATSETHGEQQETVDKEMQRLKNLTRQLQSDKDKKIAELTKMFKGTGGKGEAGGKRKPDDAPIRRPWGKGGGKKARRF